MGSKTYIGVKLVNAEPITLAEFIEKTGRNPYSNNPNPAKDLTEGYAVTYEDSYVGYSPKSVFEASYKEANDLNKTCLGVISDDYKERFKAEYLALKVRHARLKDMLEKYKSHTLTFEPICPIWVLTDQLHHMEKYLKSLSYRMTIEKININE